MRHLFRVDNLKTNIGETYSLEADSEHIAKSRLVEKFLPYIPDIDFDEFANSLANDMDIIISYLGPIDQIKKL